MPSIEEDGTYKVLSPSLRRLENSGPGLWQWPHEGGIR